MDTPLKEKPASPEMFKTISYLKFFLKVHRLLKKKKKNSLFLLSVVKFRAQKAYQARF